MILCPSCGHVAPDDSAFCPKCGMRLEPASSEARLLAEERKVVTTLFGDLVGYTALSESADPEDIDTLLGEYSSRARKVIESHGGMVEKFIGDAVVGIFGVPVVHEDDPERAVRAALRLVEALEGMTRPDGSPLQARVGVNTGEVLVRLDVDPAARGPLIGDAVNVAARLQAAAPPDGVAVGALTHELTARVIEYEELPPIAAKGKAKPVEAWLATAPVARRGLDTQSSDLTPLVGREVELAFLTAMFDKASTQSLPQFALIVGEPGIGKSRLVRELLNVVDARLEMTTWRQGYCPPFGEDIAYWALAEIVKGHAGIRDSDSTEDVSAKIEAVLPAGKDREWFAQRLRALLGLPAPQASREENFTAWLRFFEDVAARRPTILVFEDLQWADEALLVFLEHLSLHLAAVPLLLVGTARPELFERRPAFASSGRISRIGLEPLSVLETTRLVTGLLADWEEHAEGVAEVVERCDGNPFFAEQSVRLLGDAVAGGVPGSVQAVIAARLDGLSPQEKALLGDAAVVGETFWDGALTAMDGGDIATTNERLEGLVERQFVRRVRSSSFVGEREFCFVHALTRDVAYGRLPRGRRAVKHAAVAAWLEEKAGARLEDLVEVMAHHSATALELARAAGKGELAGSLAEQTVRYLTLAGDRSLQLDAAAAERQYRRALELLPEDGPGRPALLVKRGKALSELGDYRPAADVLDEAVAVLREAGDVRLAAVALGWRGYAAECLGGPAGLTLASEALSLVDEDGASQEMVTVLERLAYYCLADGDVRGALDLVGRALATAALLGLPEPAYALHLRGLGRCILGDADGLKDMRRALAAAQERGPAFDVVTIQFNLACSLWLLEGAQAAIECRRDAVDFAERHGQKGLAMIARANLAMDLVWAGEWAGALALPLESEGAISVPFLMVLYCARGLVHAWRGEIRAAREMIASADEHCSASEEPQALPWVVFAQAVVRDAVADGPGSHEALRAYERLAAGHVNEDCALRLPLAVRLALATGDESLAEMLAAQVEPSLPLYRHALASARASLDEVRDEHEAAAAGFAAAAAGWRDFGVSNEEAQALLGEGRCLLALGRAPEAAPVLRRAREIFRRLGAKPALERVDGLLQRVAASVE